MLRTTAINAKLSVRLRSGDSMDHDCLNTGLQSYLKGTPIA
jgi:hypothetical protein